MNAAPRMESWLIQGEPLPYSDLRDFTLQETAEQSGLLTGLNVTDEFEKYAKMLLHLGFIKRVPTPEGTAYKVTEAGLRFSAEYQSLERPANSSFKMDVVETLVLVAKDQVTVVIPTLNEGEGIANVVEEVKHEGFRNVLVVDGYSDDKTDEKAHRNGARVIYQHGLGKAGAVKTAIELVETPYLLVMDGDHTYDAKDIWRLLNHCGRYAHVIGARDRRNMPRLHRFGNWVISRVFSRLFEVKMTDVCSGIYLIETEQAKKYRLEESGFIVEIELAAQSASMEGLAEVPTSYRPRMGKGKLKTWRDGLAILFAAFRLSRRYKPMLLYMRTGAAQLNIG